MFSNIVKRNRLYSPLTSLSLCLFWTRAMNSNIGNKIKCGRQRKSIWSFHNMQLCTLNQPSNHHHQRCQQFVSHNTPGHIERRHQQIQFESEAIVAALNDAIEWAGELGAWCRPGAGSTSTPINLCGSPWPWPPHLVSFGVHMAMSPVYKDEGGLGEFRRCQGELTLEPCPHYFAVGTKLTRRTRRTLIFSTSVISDPAWNARIRMAERSISV